MKAERGILGLVALVVSLALQGCGSSGGGGGGGGGDTTTTASTVTTTTATTTTTTKKIPPSGWNLSPVEVRGSHLYDSATGKQFYAKGMGLPNVGEDVKEWVKVLQHIRNSSQEVNVVRIYEPPACALEGDCFEPFMKEADSLGFYVLVPGTGTTWGWLPGSPDACVPDKTAEACYKAGGVLGFGQKVIQHFNYPNTLAIVIGNEFDQQMFAYMPVLKAYARDMKAHMMMCNSDQDSPTNGQMRMIPLMYASSDDRGDMAVQPKADYMFCGGSNSSVDIFGLNVERWCTDEGGKIQYTGINSWVSPKAYPGAFMFSEMGCARNQLPPELKGFRTWHQVIDFFKNFAAFDGFFAYTYFGNPDFNMFDGPHGDATANQDGINFFDSLQKIGAQDHHDPSPTKVPECAKEILGTAIVDFNTVATYDTGNASWATSCPLPWGKKAPVESVAFVF